MQVVRTILRNIRNLADPALAKGAYEYRLQYNLMEQIKSANHSASLHPDVTVQGWPQGNLALGRNVRVEKGTVLALGDDFNGYGALEIGDGTWVGQYNNFRLAGQCSIKVGKSCLVSQFCSLVAANHSLDRRFTISSMPCEPNKGGLVVGDDVWLGAGCAILPGVSIGNGCVIGANSVVTSAVPDYEIWAGIPARKIGERR